MVLSQCLMQITKAGLHDNRSKAMLLLQQLNFKGGPFIRFCPGPAPAPPSSICQQPPERIQTACLVTISKRLRRFKAAHLNLSPALPHSWLQCRKR